MDNVADVVLSAEASGNAYGLSVSTAGDVNGERIFRCDRRCIIL